MIQKNKSRGLSSKPAPTLCKQDDKQRAGQEWHTRNHAAQKKSGKSILQILAPAAPSHLSHKQMAWKKHPGSEKPNDVLKSDAVEQVDLVQRCMERSQPRLHGAAKAAAACSEFQVDGIHAMLCEVACQRFCSPGGYAGLAGRAKGRLLSQVRNQPATDATCSNHSNYLAAALLPKHPLHGISYEAEWSSGLRIRSAYPQSSTRAPSTCCDCQGQHGAQPQ